MYVMIFGFLLCIQLFSNAAQRSAWNGENYDKNSSLQYRIGLEAIEFFDLNGSEKVLDIGCGNGKITALCAGKLKTGSLIAIDNSDSMIAFAQKNYGNIPNLKFGLQDVTTMRFDQEFDLVYSIFCLHWVKDQEVAMYNIAKALKPGGKAILYISLPNEFKQAANREFYKLIHNPSWDFYSSKLSDINYAVDKEVWLQYAQQNNLLTSFRTMHDDVVYDSYQKFKQRVTAYGIGYDIMQVMGQDTGNSFMDCYLENFYKALGLTTDQPIVWQADAIVLTLTKKAHQ